MTDTDTPSVLKRGANDGVFFGIYLSAMVALTVYSDVLALAGILSMLMFFAAPVVLFMLMWRDVRRNPHIENYSSIVLHGMITSICASLLVAVVAYLLLRFARPTYIAENIEAAKQVFQSMGKQQAAQFRALVREAGEAGALSATSFAMSYMWCYAFLGAIGSLINALIIKLIKRKPAI